MAAGGILSVVGTPLGNLGDISPRALETLRSADAILCEDTRVTAKLLSRFDIHVPLVRCDENILSSRIPGVLERLEAGERLAFVSDAGMPAISDPGQRLVDATYDAGYSVEVIPGPTAATTALAASGIACAHFFFEGFLPRGEAVRRARLAELARIDAALVIYESPKRVVATLKVLAELMSERRVALCRELTKLHEEVIRGSAQELAATLVARGELKGECVLVVAPPAASERTPELPLDAAIQEGLAAGEKTSELARRLARSYPASKSEIYRRIIELEAATSE